MRRSATGLAVLLSCVASLPSSFYPELTKVFDGALPGDVPSTATEEEEENRGYPKTPPELVGDDTLHGAAVQAAWQQTNNYARFWNINYGLLNYRGEPKHGLWKWKLPDKEKPFWWCDVGPVVEDEENASGMKGVLLQLRKSRKVWVNGANNSDFALSDRRIRGGIRAGLTELAIELVPMTLAPVPGARVWVHTGEQNELYDSESNNTKFRAQGQLVGRPQKGGLYAFEDGDVEIYLFTAYYDFGDGHPDDMFNAFYGPDASIKQCSGISSLEDYVCAQNVHSIVAVVFNTDAAEDVQGFTGFGIHFEGDEGCPEACGEVDCFCDGVLVDLALDTNLAPFRNTDWSSSRFYMPSTYPGSEGEVPEP